MSILNKVLFRTGLPHTAYFPLLDMLPIRQGFSWGKGSPNMAQKFARNPLDAKMSTEKFLENLHMALPPHAVLIVPGEGEKSDDDIMEITQNSEQRVQDNFIYTRDPRITLMVKPGDCPSSIIYAIDRNGNPLAGIGHWGRDQVISLNPAHTIAHLRDVEGCNTKDIRVAISPGIGKEHYFIQEENVVFSQAQKQEKELKKIILLDLKSWGNRATYRKKERGYYLDVKGRAIDMLIQAGILPEHIETYDVDTYEAAKKGEGFSHRYATEINHPEKNGRFILATQLAS